jgi:hypothetical protein
MMIKPRRLQVRRCAQMVIVALVAAALSGRAMAGPHEDANAADHRGDYTTELQILQPQAAQGHAWAENNLGNMYLLGNGVENDDATAMAWFSKAAAQGDAGGEVNLGQMYDRGLGVARDPARAADFYRKSAEHGPALQGWSMLKRLCDHDKNIAASDCAGIPKGTQSAPELDFHGKIGKLVFLLFKLLIAVVLMVVAIKRLRSARKAMSPTARSNFSSYLITLVGTSVAVTLLVVGPLIYAILQNPNLSTWSPAMVLWDIGVVLAGTAVTVVRARKLRRT